MRLTALAVVLLAVSSAVAGAGTGLVFRRADGSALAFTGDARSWCDADGLHVLRFGGIHRSHWQLGIERNRVLSGRTLRFTWRNANGVEIFVLDAKTRNEASEGAEGSHGRVVLRRATCVRGGRLEIAVSGVIASEFGDGKPIRVSGTFLGRVGSRPSA